MNYRMILSLLALLAIPRAARAQYPAWNHTLALPRPTGPYSVGTNTFRVDDATRPSSRHIRTRPLTVQVWYPGISGTGTPAHYMENTALVDSMIAHDYLDVSSGELRAWQDLELTARSRAKPAPAPQQRGWPILIFSHGLGVARENYAALSIELASHGYVVLTLDHPMGGFAMDENGRALYPDADSPAYHDSLYARGAREWAADAVFALRHAAGRIAGLALDTGRVGILGHSFGGAAALQACRSYTVFEACVDMDGFPFGEVETLPVGKPFLALLSEPDQRDLPPARDSAEIAHRARWAAMGRARDSLFAAVGQRNGVTPWYAAKLVGTAHYSFSDAPFLVQSHLRNTGATMPPVRMYREVADLLLGFFNHFLRAQPLRGLQPGAQTVR